MEVGHKSVVTMRGKKESIETMSTKTGQTENKEGGGEQWAGQQTEKAKRITYTAKAESVQNGKKGNNRKHKSTK